jgi:septal ring factor EnvC (AmiA/AmiB activator)
MTRFLLGLCLALSALPLYAEIFKCVDRKGEVTYSEKKENAACVALTGAVNVVPAIKVAPRAPIAPRAEPSDQRAELQKQIAAQEVALTQAKQALAEQEDIRLGGEANYQRVLDRLQVYQDKIAEIEKTLTQLREQLAALK